MDHPEVRAPTVIQSGILGAFPGTTGIDVYSAWSPFLFSDDL
jgi:hypothetical protein